MPSGFGGLLVLLLSSALTFIVARTIANWVRRNRQRKALEEARKGESRQVRRRRERRK